MNLEQLKYSVDYYANHLNGLKPDEVSVLINLSEPSIGAGASSAVTHVGMGIDWEHGQFRIEPEKPLVKKGNALTDIKKVKQFEFGGQKYYGCPRCTQRITKDDYYCRHCGQRLK